MRIEADEPEDMNGDLNNVIVIEDGLDDDAYSATFNVVKHVSPSQEVEILQSQVAGDGKLKIVSLSDYIFLRHSCDIMLIAPNP